MFSKDIRNLNKKIKYRDQQLFRKKEEVKMLICEFPYELKRADIIPCHKKDDTTNKINYRPISLLPTVSKVYEKILYAQINAFFEKKNLKLSLWFQKRL